MSKHPIVKLIFDIFGKRTLLNNILSLSVEQFIVLVLSTGFKILKMQN